MAMGKVSTDTQSTVSSAHAGEDKNKPVAAYQKSDQIWSSQLDQILLK